jgi:branched-chain amino acid transport system ATP-binding protein
VSSSSARAIRVAHPTRPPPGEGTLLEVDGVSVRYGGIDAVRSVSMRVARGEIVALLGANGAGKTTTLRATARLVPLAAGVIRFEGRDVSRAAPEELVAAGVSLVPEGRAIFGDLSVRENLELGAYAHKDARAMRETIEDVAALFPRLAERASQRAGTLSGGEQQMLAIARALMARPSLLLLDEPSLGLAPKLVQGIFDAIVAIAAAGVTILLVEQNTRVALATASRAYVLQSGEIAMQGSASELATRDEVRAAYLGG